MSNPDYSHIMVVTSTEEYIINNGAKGADGTVEGLVEDWFKTYDINRRHAYRDGSAIGGSKQFVSAEVITIEEYVKRKQEAKEKTNTHGISKT